MASIVAGEKPAWFNYHFFAGNLSFSVFIQFHCDESKFEYILIAPS